MIDTEKVLMRLVAHLEATDCGPDNAVSDLIREGVAAISQLRTRVVAERSRANLLQEQMEKISAAELDDGR